MSLEKVPNRIYSQYRQRPKFTEWLSTTKKQGESIDSVYSRIALSYDIDRAQGDELDIIGRIVGVNRDFIGKIDLDAVQFGDDDNQCGEDDSLFSAVDVASDEQMSDGLFRLLIKAKILKNNRDATIENIIEQMVLLVGVDFVRVNNPGDMTFSVEFAGAITELQRYALLNENIIQIPQGVLFNGFIDLNDVYEFGDDDVYFGNEDNQFSPYGVI